MEIAKNIYSNKILKYIVIAFAGSILLTISAKIKIPFYPVPMTMQTFVVILLGITFGYKAGAAAVCLYLIEGISGLPVFSNSPEKGVGLSYFMGPTMGYLIGFIFAAFIAGYLKYDKPVANFLELILFFQAQKMHRLYMSSLEDFLILLSFIQFFLRALLNK